MAIFWRLWATASATLAIAILIFVGLTLLQFRNVQRTLLAERVAVLAENTAKPFEAATDLGMPLSFVRNAKALLERAKQSDDAITSIHLVDPGRHVLHHVGTDGIGFASLALPMTMASGTIDLFDGARFLSFNPIAGPDGEIAGAIVISLNASDIVNRTWAMSAELGAAAIVFFVAGILVVGLALRRVFGSEIAAFDAIERDIELFERDTWRGEIPDPTEGDALRQVLNDAHARYRSAVVDAQERGYAE